METKTLAPENEFKFRCPIFPADVKIADCFKLRDMVWRGEKPPVRQGCQCAMATSKCPIPNVITKMIRLNKENYDPYHSAEPKLGKLSQDDLERIAPVLVPDSQMRRYALSAVEEKCLVQANEAARKHKPMTSKRREERVLDFDGVTETKPEETTDAVIAAAASGDLAAAITSEAADKRDGNS